MPRRGKRRHFSINIVIDSNEKRPFIFPRQHKVRFHSLKKYGSDYSVWGYLDTIGVERKTFEDWLSSIGKGWPRFKKSLSRLMKRQYRCIVVERPLSFFSPYSNMSHGAILYRTAEIAARRIPVIYCSGKDMATQFTLDFLRHSLKRETK